jgi:hypothetical protein
MKEAIHLVISHKIRPGRSLRKIRRGAEAVIHDFGERRPLCSGVQVLRLKLAKPFPNHRVGAVLQAGSVFCGVGPQLLLGNISLRREFAGVTYDPTFEAGQHHFRMELQSEQVGPLPEGLVSADLG